MPSFKRLFKSDYEADDQGLVDRLAGSLNIGIELLYDALNNRLTVKDNFAATVKDVSVTVNASGIPINTTAVALDVAGSIMGVQVIRADNLSNATTYPSGGVFISFTQSNNSLIINHVTGLQANNTYRLKLIAWNA
jgi:hypothetical protein